MVSNLRLCLCFQFKIAYSLMNVEHSRNFGENHANKLHLMLIFLPLNCGHWYVCFDSCFHSWNDAAIKAKLIDFSVFRNLMNQPIIIIILSTRVFVFIIFCIFHKIDKIHLTFLRSVQHLRDRLLLLFLNLTSSIVFDFFFICCVVRSVLKIMRQQRV